MRTPEEIREVPVEPSVIEAAFLSGFIEELAKSSMHGESLILKEEGSDVLEADLRRGFDGTERW